MNLSRARFPFSAGGGLGPSTGEVRGYEVANPLLAAWEEPLENEAEALVLWVSTRRPDACRGREPQCRGAGQAEGAPCAWISCCDQVSCFSAPCLSFPSLVQALPSAGWVHQAQLCVTSPVLCSAEPVSSGLWDPERCRA